MFLSPFIRKITANNINIMTRLGSNSYLIGNHECALIDPGPNDPQHFENILKALNNRILTHIFVTHHHQDHYGLAEKVSQHFNIPIYKGLSHSDISYRNTALLYKTVSDKQSFHSKEWTIQAIHTPGHTNDHYCFYLQQGNSIFTGDHIMAFSTSLIAPPEGDLTAYLSSLEKLYSYNAKCYYPGHGPNVNAPQKRTKALKIQRHILNRAIIECLKRKQHTISSIRKTLYKRQSVAFNQTIELNLYAHILYLIKRNIIKTNKENTLNSTYHLK